MPDCPGCRARPAHNSAKRAPRHWSLADFRRIHSPAARTGGVMRTRTRAPAPGAEASAPDRNRVGSNGRSRATGMTLWGNSIERAKTATPALPE